MFVIGLLVGLFIGAFIGILIMALISIAKYNDKERTDK